MKVNSKKEGFSYYHSIIGVLIGAVFGCFVIIGYIQYVKLSEFNDPIFNMGIERNMKEFIKNEIHYFRGNSKSNAVPNENKEVINGRNMGADANPDRDKKTQDGKHNAVGRYIVDAEIESNTKNRRIVENLYEIRNNLISSGKMVDNKEQPIDDTVTHVIQCSTSLGNITMDIRKNWAPFGVKRFLSMLEKDFFNDLSFFRVAPRYITQFGAKYREPNSITNTLNCQSFEDDRSMWNVRDMDMGYIFFAGSGINSRGCQMVFSLCEMGGCKQTTLGSTPWEVPIGTIRKDGFNVLRDIGQTGFPYPKLEMQGQHKDAAGPNQELIRKDKNYLKETYPDMAYFRHCRMVQEDVSLYRPIVIDHPETTYGISSQSNGKSKLLLPDIENIRKLGTFKPHIYVEFVVGITADSTLSNNAGEGVEISESEYILIFEIFPDWAPLGASRFLELVFDGYFDNNVFFRVIKVRIGVFYVVFALFPFCPCTRRVVTYVYSFGCRDLLLNLVYLRIIRT